MDKKLRVGIVGTGKFAKGHVDVWRSLDLVELVGVHGSDKERLALFSKEFGIKGYSDYNSLIKDSDIVDIVSANYTHCDYAIPVLKNEKYVIVEKPLDIVYEKAYQLYKFSEDNERMNSVISQYRFQRAFQRLKKILDTKQLGKIESSRISITWPRSEDYFNHSGSWKAKRSMAGGGVLMHQCIHFIDLLHWFFGDAISVSGRKDCVNKEGIEKSFCGEIEFKDGHICQLDLTTMPSSSSCQRLEVLGTKGRVIINGSRIFKKTKEGLLKDTLENVRSYVDRLLEGPENSNALLRRQFLNIIESISKKVSPLVTIKDGLIALRTVLQLYKASEQGKRMFLDSTGLL